MSKRESTSSSPDKLLVAKRQLHEDLGYKTLNPLWAKLEIFLGLTTNGGGIALFVLFVVLGGQGQIEPILLTMSLVIYVLGGYWVLAGSRSHLYQSFNNHTAYLLQKINEIKEQQSNSTPTTK